jgi:hypothetical protein
VGGSLEADATGELTQLVAADDELAGLTVYMAEARLCRDDAIEATRLYRAVDETALISW